MAARQYVTMTTHHMYYYNVQLATHTKIYHITDTTLLHFKMLDVLKALPPDLGHLLLYFILYIISNTITQCHYYQYHQDPLI